MRIAVTSFTRLLTRISALAIIMTALPQVSAAAEMFAISDDDGTYKTVVVKSAKECTKLCKAEDGACRGTLLLEETTIMNGKKKSVMQCRLNDGLSPKSPFEIKPPTPLDLTTAVTELNRYRSEYGLSPVTLNEKLGRASEVHAADLAKHGQAAHIGSDGSSHADRAQRQGYYFSTVAENVATGQNSWDVVFQAWKDSPGHNKNLLAEGVTDFGVALVYEPTTTYIYYWAMLVGAQQPDFVHPTSAMTVRQKAMLDADKIAGK